MFTDCPCLAFCITYTHPHTHKYQHSYRALLHTTPQTDEGAVTAVMLRPVLAPLGVEYAVFSPADRSKQRAFSGIY